MKKILDHGYVEKVTSWGSDEAIVEAARMSTGGGFVSWEPYEGHPRGDLGLLSHLWTKKHATPFEMAGMTVEACAPIMVFREWHRHRTQSYSEASARYAPLPAMDYLPTVERCVIDAGRNKQAGAAEGSATLTLDAVDQWRRELAVFYADSQDLYERGLGLGIPKELARLALTVGRYSTMRASANLRNWLGFLTLRMAPDAQWEIRQYANAVGEMIAEAFPRTWDLFMKGKP